MNSYTTIMVCLWLICGQIALGMYVGDIKRGNTEMESAYILLNNDPATGGVMTVLLGPIALGMRLAASLD